MIKKYGEFINEDKTYPYYNEKSVELYSDTISDLDLKAKEISLELSKIWNDISFNSISDLIKEDIDSGKYKSHIQNLRNKFYRTLNKVQAFIDNIPEEEYEDKFDGEYPLDMVVSDIQYSMDDKFDFLDDIIEDIKDLIDKYEDKISIFNNTQIEL